MRLYFADFALEFLDCFFSLQGFDFQRVELAWRTKLQLHNALQSFDGAIFCAAAEGYEMFGIGDLCRQEFTPV